MSKPILVKIVGPLHLPLFFEESLELDCYIDYLSMDDKLSMGIYDCNKKLVYKISSDISNFTIENEIASINSNTYRCDIRENSIQLKVYEGDTDIKYLMLSLGEIDWNKSGGKESIVLSEEFEGFSLLVVNCVEPQTICSDSTLYTITSHGLKFF